MSAIDCCYQTHKEQREGSGGECNVCLQSSCFGDKYKRCNGLASIWVEGCKGCLQNGPIAGVDNQRVTAGTVYAT